jgi:hypothetical protein
VSQGQDDGTTGEIEIDDTTDTGGAVDDDGASGDGDATATGGGGEGQPVDGDTGTAKPPLPRPAPPRQAGKPDSWKPPTKEEWEAQTKAARLAAREAKERKEELRKLRLESASETERREAELVDRTRAEAKGELMPLVISAKAEAALAGAGCRDKTDRDRLVALIRQSVTVEDGEVVGLDEQVQDLTSRYPELFRVKRQTLAGGPQASADDGVVNPGPGRAPGKKLSASERQAAALTGRRPAR